MLKKGIFVIAIVFASMMARAQDNCWGTGKVDSKRIEKLMSVQPSFLVDNPFSELFTVLSKFVPEPVRFVYDPSTEFNATATQFFGRRVVTLFHGVSTHALSNPDTAALVACHEVGHHFAGAPFVFGGMSNEGQSDFWGVQDCFKYWVDSSAPFDPKDTEATEFCENNLGRKDTMCIRSLSASLHLARIISEVKSHPKPFLTSKDSSVVKRTESGHPIAQCRLDTYKAGYEFLAGGKSLGETRPLCWFAPNATPANRLAFALTKDLLNSQE